MRLRRRPTIGLLRELRQKVLPLGHRVVQHLRLQLLLLIADLALSDALCHKVKKADYRTMRYRTFIEVTFYVSVLISVFVSQT